VLAETAAQTVDLTSLPTCIAIELKVIATIN